MDQRVIEHEGIAQHNQLRLDPLSGRWVVVSTGRADRPAAFARQAPPPREDTGRPCPFCPGNEEASPPALETYGPSGLLAGAGGAQPLPGLRG